MKYDKERIKIYTEYAEDVLAERVVSGKYIKLAARRYLDWFERDDIFFDVDRMDKIVKFVGFAKHFEDEFAGKPFVLLPFQIFVLANTFGWYYTANPEKRVIENVIMFIARKNAKTAFAAMMMIVETCVNKIQGSQQIIAANSREQARIAYQFVKGYCRSLDPKGKHFRIYQNRIEYPKTNSIIKVISSDAGLQDGLNPSTYLIDEYHAAPNDSIFQVLRSAHGARLNPMSIIISSGGYLMDGFPFYDRVVVAHQRLEGTLNFPDNTFYALFELDPDDDWKDEANWQKANPSLGQICKMKFMRESLEEAMVSVTSQVDFKIKNLDLFVSTKNIWLDVNTVGEVYQKVDFDKLKGEICYAGCDLSSTGDLTSVAICFPPSPYREYYPDKYIFKAFCWIPQAALDGSNGNLYTTFIHKGLAKMTSGNSVDYDEILKDVLEINNKYPIAKFCYDPYNSTQFIQNAVSQGINCVPMSQSLGSFNRGTKGLEIMIKRKECIIAGDTLISWAFNNVELKYDSYGNCKPVKANGVQTKKIDPVIAIIQALSGHLFELYFNSDMSVMTLE